MATEGKQLRVNEMKMTSEEQDLLLPAMAATTERQGVVGDIMRSATIDKLRKRIAHLESDFVTQKHGAERVAVVTEILHKMIQNNDPEFWIEAGYEDVGTADWLKKFIKGNDL